MPEARDPHERPEPSGQPRSPRLPRASVHPEEDPDSLPPPVNPLALAAHAAQRRWPQGATARIRKAAACMRHDLGVSVGAVRSRARVRRPSTGRRRGRKPKTLSYAATASRDPPARPPAARDQPVQAGHEPQSRGTLSASNPTTSVTRPRYPEMKGETFYVIGSL